MAKEVKLSFTKALKKQSFFGPQKLLVFVGLEFKEVQHKAAQARRINKIEPRKNTN